MPKLEKILLFLLFFLLPSQLALHFWPSWSLVNGIRVDYLSPTLYLTDILIIILLILSRTRVHVPVFIILFSVFNILIAHQPLIALYKYARLFEYFLFFKYLLSRYSDLNLPLSLSIIWTSLLAWAQFFLQHSIGGPLYWLGERAFDITTPGIAKIAINGHLFLRPYATLPHPNALAGFLLISALILLYLKNKSYLVAFATLPLTFSHTAILLEALILIFLIFKTKHFTKYIFLPILFFAVYYLIFRFPLNPQSLSERVFLNQLAINLTQQHLIFGVGLGNFIPATANYLRQPVHNIYLLISSELGLPALFIITYFIIKKLFKIKNSTLKIAVLAVLATGLIDHYWLTLHQNTLLLVILISFTYEHLAPHR